MCLQSPSKCNGKSSDGTPGRAFVSRVYKSACVMVFSSHVYECPAKLENQRAADANQSLWAQQCSDVFGEGNKNSELYFTPSLIWSSEDTEIMLGRTVLKTVWKRSPTNWSALHGLWEMSHGLTFLVTTWLFWHPSTIITEILVGMWEGVVWPVTLECIERCIDVPGMLEEMFMSRLD